MKEKPWLVPILLAVAVCLLVAQQLWLSSYTVDDAYISFRYARNLIEGHGLVFNPGERVEGYTNFLWTVIIAWVMALGADPVAASKVLGMLANVGTLYLTYRLSMLTRPASSPWLLSLLAVAMLAVNGAFATAAITGLETSLFTLLVVVGAYSVVVEDVEKKETAKWPGLPAIFFALSALVRPEGVAVFVASVGLKALSHNFRREDLRSCVEWVILFAAVYLPYLAWRVWYYGGFFPNTYYAKTGAGLAQYYKGILDLKAFSLTYLGILFLVALAVLARRKSPFWLTYLTGLTLTIVTVSIYEGGDWIPFFRFLVPALPFYYVVIQEAGRRLSVNSATLKSPLPKWAISREPWPNVALGLVCLAMVGLTAWPSLGMHEQLAREAKGHELAHATLGRWLEEKASGSVALMDIGLIGFISRLPIVDTSGLTDPQIAHSEGGLIDKKFDLAYVLGREPQYFVLASTSDFVKNGGKPTDFPIERRIYDDERFEQSYSYLFTLDSGWEVEGKGYYLMVYERR